MERAQKQREVLHMDSWLMSFRAKLEGTHTIGHPKCPLVAHRLCAQNMERADTQYDVQNTNPLVLSSERTTRRGYDNNRSQTRCMAHEFLIGLNKRGFPKVGGILGGTKLEKIN